ncbi:MAG TPA: ATP-binding protein [Holophagaceae bacterium]|nr:ATP-binding protein [Holophagaceae bacterium]
MSGLPPSAHPSQRLQALAAGQRRVVELLAREAPLPEVLSLLCQLVEEQLPGALCSILLLDPEGQRIRDGAGPRLPTPYRAALEGLPIGPEVGSCGTAMFLREPVVTEDIAADPRWEAFRDLALPHGLGACASTPIFDGSGGVLGSFAIYHAAPGPFEAEELEVLGHMNHLASLAISHHRQVAALAEQVERLAMTQRLAQLGFWTWTVADDRLEGSDGLYEIYGLDQGGFDPTFEGLLSRVHPEDQARVRTILGTALAAGGAFAFEERILRPGGEVRWLRSWGQAFEGGQGRIERLMGTCHDITGLRSGEQELLRFRALIENNPDFVAMADLEGRVTYLNPAGRRLVGLPSQEAARSLSIRDFLTEEGLQRSRDIEVPAVKAQGHWTGESSLRHFETGEVIPVEISSFLVRDPATGAPLCLATTQRDLRGQKQTEEALRQAQKLESLAVLAGGIAHDFNNFLTAMLGNLELARAAAQASPGAGRYLDRLADAVGRASDLARQMLAYSGKGRVVVKPLDLNRLIEEMSQLLASSMPKKTRLILELEADLPPVEGDATQLQQVVMNLLINAAESLPEGEGGIRLRTALERQPPASPGVFLPGGQRREGPHVRLEVEDTGGGMSEEVASRIFDPFFTTKPTGRGLGLSAMLGILRGHQGAIQVQSAPGQGTCFTLWFPAADRPAEVPGPESAGSPLPGGLVLVVDDEPEIRASASALLELLGFETLQASDGLEALDRVRERGGDLSLVLLDLSMPRLDGRQAFEGIRALQPDLKVILSSGFDLQEAAQGIVGRGLAGFLQKPYTLQGLERALRALLA